MLDPEKIKQLPEDLATLSPDSPVIDMMKLIATEGEIEKQYSWKKIHKFQDEYRIIHVGSEFLSLQITNPDDAEVSVTLRYFQGGYQLNSWKIPPKTTITVLPMEGDILPINFAAMYVLYSSSETTKFKGMFCFYNNELIRNFTSNYRPTLHYNERGDIFRISNFGYNLERHYNNERKRRLCVSTNSS